MLGAQGAVYSSISVVDDLGKTGPGLSILLIQSSRVCNIGSKLGHGIIYEDVLFLHTSMGVPFPRWKLKSLLGDLDS